MPLASTSNRKGGAYKLNLDPQKPNVFVTQLTDRDEYNGELHSTIICNVTVL